jgi:hypothetical protein
MTASLVTAPFPSSASKSIQPANTCEESLPQDPGSQEEWDPSRSGIGDLTEGPREEAARPKKDLTIEGRLFTREQFAAYVKHSIVPELKKKKKPGELRAQFIVLHHTGVPSIQQRPNGFTTSNMHALAHFYGFEQRWPSGPHLFIDQNGIWVFTSLLKVGTHSPSWNNKAWGIEQLGNYSIEDYDSGKGEKIRDNAIAAIAILSVARNLDAETLRFHFEDTLTTHKNCPGTSCKKPDVLTKVKSEIERWRAAWPTL